MRAASGDVYYPAVVSVPPPLRDRCSLFDGAMLRLCWPAARNLGDFGGCGPAARAPRGCASVG